MSDAISDPPTPAIDWSAISANVECPLCLYNLRGLVEPRCPECGYRFEWKELLNPQHAAQRYLFEHQRRRNIWSFFRTLIAGLRTRRFWAKLLPVDALVPRRLIVYWFLCSSFLPLLPLSVAIGVGAPLAAHNASLRKQITFPSTATPAGREKWLNTFYPLPPHAQFFRQLAGRIRPSEFWWFVAPPTCTILAWPWLTYAALMIFRASMHRAMAQRSHVLRCVVYSADASVWYLLVMFLLTILTVLAILASAERFLELLPRLLTTWLMVLLWLMRLDRLAVAYRLYLRFDHPFLTALASQVLVGLAMFIVLLWCGMLI
jgi:hypothetical protein